MSRPLRQEWPGQGLYRSVHSMTAPTSSLDFLISSASRRIGRAASFLLPLLVIFLIWPILTAALDVNPRVFPGPGMVWNAALESIRDGTLVAHIGASLT